MLELKKLAGVLNTDDPYESVNPQHHIYAKNIRFVNGQVQSIKGNTLVAYTMPTGTNITIGNCYDDLEQRIFFLNYNSNAENGIYIYYIRTNTIVPLKVNGVDTDGDVFNFTADSYFPDVRIMYGDDTQGDILYWVNSQKKPCKINIDRALNVLGTYGVIHEPYLDVDKAIAQIPPAVVFEDDVTISVNNFRKKLMKYKTRFVYDDNDKSCYSAHSVIPLPIGYTDSNADFNADPTKNCRVAIVIPTGPPNVKKIEICACESLGNVFSDWFLIHVIDKVVDVIDNDTLTTYRFYNDQAYTYIDVPESLQEYDWVPQEANAQELLNGNVLAYGGILEGYNQIVSDSVATSDTEELIKTTQYPFIFVGNQSGNSGFGEGEILVKYIGKVVPGWIYHIITTNEDIFYTAEWGDDASDVLAGLAAAAILLGFTATSDTEDLVIEKADEQLLLVYVEPEIYEFEILAQAVAWDLSDQTLTFTGLASQYYLFPIGGEFTLANSSTPSFDDTYTGIATVAINGSDIVVTFTDPVIVTADTSFTADVTFIPGIVSTTTYENASIEWVLADNKIYLNQMSQYYSVFANASFFEIANAVETDLNGIYTIVSVEIDNLETTTLNILVAETIPDALILSPGDVIIYTDAIAGNPYAVSDSPSYDWSSSYAFGVEYFDYWGRTMGVVTQRLMSVQTIPYADSGSTEDVYLPKIGLEIYQRPPEEAKYFHIVRTKNLTKSNFIQWISNATYKDAEFAYVSIEILNQYIIINPQSSFLAWDFTPGDRIRFMKTLSSGTNATYGSSRDYEIQASLTDPYINGVLIEGQVLKMPLPSTDSIFNFGGGDWANYLIEVYTPAKSVGNGLDVYYEFGERYMIGDAGLETRFHQGMFQNQSTDLVTPATFEFIQGDNYFTQRTLNIGNVIQYSVGPGQLLNTADLVPTTAGGSTVELTVISSYDVQDYVVNDEPVATPTSPVGNDVVNFIKVLANEYTFQIKGSVKVLIDGYDMHGNPDAGLVLYIFDNVTGPYGPYYEVKDGPFVSGQVLEWVIDTTITRDSASGGVLSMFITPTYLTGTDIEIQYTAYSGYLNVTQLGQIYTVGIQNPNYSFFYESAVNANGRPWVVNPDGRQSYNMALMRYGGAYQQDTNINSVNRFYSSQLDEYDRSKGDIRRFVFRQRILRVFQSAGVGQVGVYAQFITNSNGATQLIYTTNIITANNIQYYVGEHGMGAQNSGLISNRNADVFPDPVTGEIIRVSNDGMTSLTDLYKGQYYISSLITPYNFEWDRLDGSKAKILGAYDFLEEQYTFVLQSGSRNDGSGTITIDSYAFSFNEKRNAFCSFYDFNDAESILAGENILYSFLNGQVYQHNNSNAYANFYGLQYAPEITIDFNGGEAAKKTFAALSYQSNGVWTAPDIGTQVEQNSKLVAANFKKLEGFYHAAFLRDLNVRGGWINGPTLKGGWLTIRLVGPATGSYYYLSAISVKSIPSQLNNE